MRLSKVAITNHSRIQDLNFEVRRHAVIVGADDVGKSSILRMLNLLLGTSTAGLYQALKPGDLRDQEQRLVVNALWSGFTDENRRVFPSEISIAEDADLDAATLRTFGRKRKTKQFTAHLDHARKLV